MLQRREFGPWCWVTRMSAKKGNLSKYLLRVCNFAFVFWWLQAVVENFLLCFANCDFYLRCKFKCCKVAAKDLIRKGDQLLLPITVKESHAKKHGCQCSDEEMSYIRSLELHKVRCCWNTLLIIESWNLIHKTLCTGLFWIQDSSIIAINKPPKLPVQVPPSPLHGVLFASSACLYRLILFLFDLFGLQMVILTNCSWLQLTEFWYHDNIHGRGTISGVRSFKIEEQAQLILLLLKSNQW